MPNMFVQSLDGSIPLKLPPHWRVQTIADFKALPERPEAATLAAKALKNPLGAPLLENRLSADNTVSIIVEDLTRSSPKDVILRILLKRLEDIGIQRDHISIVIALGTHQPLSSQEMEKTFGKDLTVRYHFFNHDCRAADLVPVGRLGTGKIVKINRRVSEADFRIGIGSIFPHPLNGFGGGGKILFPGVADVDSIVEHHFKHSFRGRSCLGVMDGNEFHEEVTAMAKAGGLDFIINSVLDHRDRLYNVVCGAPFEAHRAGTTLCRTIIAKDFLCKSDVTIISAFPYSQGPQIMKPLAPAAMVTRRGGCIILYADCKVPLPAFYFEACERFRAEYGSCLRRTVLERFARQCGIMADAPPELNMSMAQVMLTLNDFHVILVSRDMPRGQVERLGFAFAEDMNAAIAQGSEKYHQATVNIVPSGGVILPIVSE